MIVRAVLVGFSEKHDQFQDKEIHEALRDSPIV